MVQLLEISKINFFLKLIIVNFVYIFFVVLVIRNFKKQYSDSLCVTKRKTHFFIIMSQTILF